MRHVLRVLLVLAVLALALLVGERAVDLARHGFRPTAHGEARWIGWAGGTEAERALDAELAAVPVETLPAGPLFLITEQRGVRSFWLWAMGQYRLPGRPVVGVSTPARKRAPPPESAVVHLPAAAARTEHPGEGMAGLAWGLAGLLLVLLVGRWVAPSPGLGPGGDLVRGFAVSLVVGFPCLALALLLLGRLGMEPGPAVICSAPFLIALGVVVHGPGPPLSRQRLSPADALLAGGLGLFVARVAAAPLWSWDHHAIWGLKARRLAAAGVGPELEELADLPFGAPHYPLGVPLGWVTMAVGRVPGDAVFRLAHIAFGVALVLLVREAVRRVGGRESLAALAATAVALSPLLWDTESLGLADLPLALWAIAAVVLVLDGAPWVAGLSLGFLPWIKLEGWPLALLLLPLLLREASRRGRRGVAAVTVPAAGMAVASRLAPLGMLGEGVGFLSGDWSARLLARLTDLPQIASLLARELVQPGWLGLWLVFPVGLVVAVRRDRRQALLLGGAVVAQLLLYGGVYLASYVEPAEHIASSFYRITAALLPLAVVAIAWALEGRTGPAAPVRSSSREPPAMLS